MAANCSQTLIGPRASSREKSRGTRPVRVPIRASRGRAMSRCSRGADEAARPRRQRGARVAPVSVGHLACDHNVSLLSDVRAPDCARHSRRAPVTATHGGNRGNSYLTDSLRTLSEQLAPRSSVATAMVVELGLSLLWRPGSIAARGTGSADGVTWRCCQMPRQEPQ